MQIWKRKRLKSLLKELECLMICNLFWIINIEKGRKGMEYYTYPEAVELFREYFGVGRTPETSLGLYSIAKNMLKKYFGFGKKNVTMTTMAKKHKVSRALISQKIDFVSILLKQKYARDIWYDTI